MYFSMVGQSASGSHFILCGMLPCTNATFTVLPLAEIGLSCGAAQALNTKTGNMINAGNARFCVSSINAPATRATTKLNPSAPIKLANSLNGPAVWL